MSRLHLRFANFGPRRAYFATVLDGSGDRRRGRGSFGGKFGASHCNKWGLCDATFPKLLWAGLVLFSVRVSFHELNVLID